MFISLFIINIKVRKHAGICHVDCFRSFSDTPAEPDHLTTHLLSHIHNLESFELATYSPILESALGLHKCGLLQLGGRVQKARGLIQEPTGKSEIAVRFIAGLTMGIDVVASVENLNQVQDVCVRVSVCILWVCTCMYQTHPWNANWKWFYL